MSRDIVKYFVVLGCGAQGQDGSSLLTGECRPRLGLFSFVLHSANIAQFREDLFPLNKTRERKKRPLPADNGADVRRWGEEEFWFCYTRHLRAIPNSVAAGRAVVSSTLREP
jgi:hypothetical protein